MADLMPMLINSFVMEANGICLKPAGSVCKAIL